MELQVINPEDYKLEPQKAESIIMAFSTKQTELNICRGVYANIIGQSITLEDGSLNYELIEQAKELDKTLMELGKDTNKTHKVEKDYFLQAGRFVDANKNVITHHIDDMRKQLKQIFDYEKIQAKLEEEGIYNERVSKLNAIGFVGDMEQFKTLDDATFDIFLKAKQEDFKKAEQLRLEEEAYNNGVADLYKLTLVELVEYKSDNPKLMELASTRLVELKQNNYNEQYNCASISGIYDTTHLTDEQISNIIAVIEKQKEQALNEQFNKELHVINNTTDINYIIQYKGSRLDELQQALNSRLVALDEIRISNLKSNINAIITNVRNDIDSGKIVDFSRITLDAQEFTDIWNAEVEKLKVRFEKKQAEILARNNEVSLLCSQLPNGVNVVEEFIVSDYTSYGNVNTISFELLEQIKLDHANKMQEELSKQGDAAVIKAWIDSFSISECSVSNDNTRLIVEQFNKFKEWAKTKI